MISKSLAINVEFGYQYDKFNYKDYETIIINGFPTIVIRDFDISGKRLNLIIGMSVSL